MNSNLESLYKIGQKSSRIIVGLMSGTSMDGLDVALCKISGAGENTEVELLHFDTLGFSNEIKIEIQKVFAKQNIDFQTLVLLNEWIGILHADLVLECLKNWDIKPNQVDLIASHGQTVFHSPKILHQLEKFPNGSLQIGDGDHIAVKTGIITLSDFRQKHLAAGGEGAPLAVYGDYLIFGKKGENRIMLNIGGISNFTFLPENRKPEDVFVTDTGAGNTLIDAFTHLYFPDKSYDKDAEIASQGTVNQLLLIELKSDSFFRDSYPKTTGPELFNINYVRKAQKKSNTEKITVPDLLATLTRFTAETIAESLFYAINKTNYDIANVTVYLSGGGMHNPLLKKWLQELVGCKFSTSNVLGISGDAKEAVLFAVLANETVSGGKTDFGADQGVPSVSLGKISFPN
jgi:anhydro-N-acetylmuramic acid kinase